MPVPPPVDYLNAKKTKRSWSKTSLSPQGKWHTAFCWFFISVVWVVLLIWNWPFLSVRTVWIDDIKATRSRLIEGCYYHDCYSRAWPMICDYWSVCHPLNCGGCSSIIEFFWRPWWRSSSFQVWNNRSRAVDFFLAEKERNGRRSRPLLWWAIKKRIPVRAGRRKRETWRTLNFDVFVTLDLLWFAAEKEERVSAVTRKWNKEEEEIWKEGTFSETLSTHNHVSQSTGERSQERRRRKKRCVQDYKSFSSFLPRTYSVDKILYGTEGCSQRMSTCGIVTRSKRKEAGVQLSYQLSYSSGCLQKKKRGQKIGFRKWTFVELTFLSQHFCHLLLCRNLFFSATLSLSSFDRFSPISNNIDHAHLTALSASLDQRLGGNTSWNGTVFQFFILRFIQVCRGRTVRMNEDNKTKGIFWERERKKGANVSFKT